MNKSKEFIVIGNGGHASVVIDLLESCHYKIAGVLVKDWKNKKFMGYPVLGDDSLLMSFKKNKYFFAIGIGTFKNSSKTRKDVFQRLKKLKLLIPPIVHSSAIVSPRAELLEGCQILSGAIVGVNAKVGENTIVNTNSSIDHHSILNRHCHIAPSVTICGNVILGENVFVGAGSTIINDIKIGNNCLIGAGSLVIKDITISGKYFGNPVKKK